ncbi:uncharacterized protein B0I36DRAFT_339382 [Microdochium trichocladiopsis]|uniref:Uncharacterized protein n=1 Tax=Microdochium trichocladiopsis TaxID=1682393 RepID=A0A9P8XRA8_9PEZI|nr:uncharacterized protein B0I36DRAFT_339382 [Microdochium trichocladiopsis]KAH7012482.1 hypothetical protein B0I36DRAFT_339382 [Microdochium trichocladiopsis]
MTFTSSHFPTTKKEFVEEKSANEPLADILSLTPGATTPGSRNPSSYAPRQSQLEPDARQTQNAHVSDPKDCHICRHPHNQLYFPGNGTPGCTAGKGMTAWDHMLADLSVSIPAAGAIAPEEGCGVTAKDLQAPMKMVDQMTLIDRATAYISLLEDRSWSLLDERRALKSKIAAFEGFFADQ